MRYFKLYLPDSKICHCYIASTHDDISVEDIPAHVNCPGHRAMEISVDEFYKFYRSRNNN